MEIRREKARGEGGRERERKEGRQSEREERRG
jgi:hypothetical protein